MMPVRLECPSFAECVKIQRPKLRARGSCALFASLNDFGNRPQLERRDFAGAGRANALQALSGNRHEALWEAIAAVPEGSPMRGSSASYVTPQ